MRLVESLDRAHLPWMSRALLTLLPWMLVGCAGRSPEPPGAAAAPLAYEEHLTGGVLAGDTPVPLIVAMHGRGGDMQTFQRFFGGFDAPARIAYLDAPIDEGDGRAWFTFGGGMGGAMQQMLDLLPRLDATLAALVRARPVAGKPIVTGFSQGAMLAYLLALQRPSVYGGAVPVSGALFSGAVPERLVPSEVPPIVALHGDADEIIPFDADLDAQSRLRARGVEIEVEIVPGGHHWIDGALKQRFHARLAERVRAQATH